MFVLQQLEIITPFQLYFNPDLILKNYQVKNLDLQLFVAPSEPNPLIIEITVFSFRYGG